MGKATRFTESIKRRTPNYQREQYRTFMTTTEWRAVEMAEEMAGFLGENKPLYRFPFFKQALTMWQILFSSVKAARRHSPLKDILLSEYMLMDVFITSFISMSFITKGLVSMLFWPWMQKENPTEFQAKVAEKVKAYGEFNHKVPFYNYPYLQERKNLAQDFKESKNKTLADYVTFAVGYTEMILRGITSFPIAYWYNQPENTEIDTLDLVVKSKQHPRKLQNESLKISVQGYQYKTIDGKRQYYVHCRIPRYDHFEPSLRHLFSHESVVHNISGCKNIQVKIQQQPEQELPPGLEVLYHNNHYVARHKTVELNVPVKALHTQLKQLDERNIKINYLHDF